MLEDNEIKQVFKRAAEIAKSVPAALQESAFNRALDALLPKSLRGYTIESEQKRGGKRTRRKASQQKGAQASIGKKQVARKKTGRLGPKAALEELLQMPFWSQPRTIGQLQEHLRTTRGYKYKLGELSVSLVRLVRDGKLERTKNKDNQYEYKRH